MSDHPEVPPEEWNGQHVDWREEKCRLCGGEIKYVGCMDCELTECAESGEVLFLE